MDWKMMVFVLGAGYLLWNKDEVKTMAVNITSDFTSGPRGLRNNNPGNIRHNPNNNWQGARQNQTDSEFVQFISSAWGIRALMKTLRNYQSRHGLNTINGIINRWAPPVENNTGSYVDAVSARAGILPHQYIDLNSRATIISLASAIIHHENGRQPYTRAELEAAEALV